MRLAATVLKGETAVACGKQQQRAPHLTSAAPNKCLHRRSRPRCCPRLQLTIEPSGVANNWYDKAAGGGAAGTGGTGGSNGGGGASGNDSEMTEEEMIAEAIRRSMQDQS